MARELPILFSGRLVRKILAGHKTETRRPIKPAWTDHKDPPAYFPKWGAWAPGCANTWQIEDGECPLWRSPYGEAGDRLYVRETWAVGGIYDNTKPSKIHQGAKVAYQASGKSLGLKHRPSIHMPKWAARVWLDVTGVRMDRLQCMDQLDALNEGYEGKATRGVLNGVHGMYVTGDPREQFAESWDKIYKSRGLGWEANPWVWVIDFKRTENRPKWTAQTKWITQPKHGSTQPKHGSTKPAPT